MPGVDGFELVRQVRQSPQRDLPSIASRAGVSVVEQGDSIAAGCNDSLPKPLDCDLLLRCLQKYLNLEWVYEERDSAASAPAPESPSVVPPADLEQAVRLGDFAAIEREVERLRAIDPDYAAFCDRLRDLAREFDDAAIVTLLQAAD